MTEEQSFFIAVINLMPQGSISFIQSPSLENESILSRMEETEYKYYKSLKLIPENKKVLIDEIINSNIQDYIQLIEIRHNEHLLFEGFDGVEFGTISKSINLSKDFAKKYIEREICTVSNEW